MRGFLITSDVPGSRFFVLEEGMFGPDDTQFSKIAPVNRGEPPQCPRCGEPMGLLTWLPPYRVELELYGARLGDFVKGPGDDVLISSASPRHIKRQDWQGEDVFRPRGKRGSIVVSERFTALVQRRHGLTNMKFTPIEEYV